MGRGLPARFGLVHIDYATQQRRLKDSGKWYRAFLRGKNGGLSVDR
jgi:beta-glucosidase